MKEKEKNGFWEENKTIVVALVISALIILPLLVVFFDEVIN